MILKALNPVHQTTLNRAVNSLIKYNEWNDKREHAENEELDKEFKKADRMCEHYFDKFEYYLADLPKREQKVILKSELY